MTEALQVKQLDADNKGAFLKHYTTLNVNISIFHLLYHLIAVLLYNTQYVYRFLRKVTNENSAPPPLIIPGTWNLKHF